MTLMLIFLESSLYLIGLIIGVTVLFVVLERVCHYLSVLLDPHYKRASSKSPVDWWTDEDTNEYYLAVQRWRDDQIFINTKDI